MILESTAPEVRNDSPGPVSAPEKEAPLTDTDSLTTFHGDSFPPYCCEHCEARKREGLAVKARANLLRQAVTDREPWGVLAWNAVELVEMMRARGMA